MKTEIVKLPSGRLVRGIVLESLHHGPRRVFWAGMEVWGHALLPAEIQRIEDQQ